MQRKPITGKLSDTPGTAYEKYTPLQNECSPH